MSETTIFLTLIASLITLYLWGVFVPKFMAEFLADDWLRLPKWQRALIRGAVPKIHRAISQVWNEVDIAARRYVDGTPNTIDNELYDMLRERIEQSRGKTDAETLRDMFKG